MPKHQSTVGKKARAAANTGTKYTTALREQAAGLAGPDPDAMVWLLVSLTTDPGQDGRGVDDLRAPDRAAVALALSGVWQYAGIPCPRVIVYPAVTDPERVVLLARVAFARPPAGGITEKLDRLADTAQHALAMRDRPAVTAVAQLAPAADVERFGALAIEHGEQSPEIAERDWWRHAMVRLTRDVITDSPYVNRPTRHHAGQVMTLWQRGRKDWPIDTSLWSTSLDADLTGFVPDDAVTLVEVLEEQPPREADPVEPLHARLARRWTRAMALAASLTDDDDDTATIGERVQVHEHRKEVTRAVRNEVQRIRRHAHGHAEPALVALIADVLEDVPLQWYVQEVRATAAALRTLIGSGSDAVLDLSARMDEVERALDQVLMADGALGVDARLTPRERTAAKAGFGARLAAVFAAEQGTGRKAMTGGQGSAEEPDRKVVTGEPDTAEGPEWWPMVAALPYQVRQLRPAGSDGRARWVLVGWCEQPARAVELAEAVVAWHGGAERAQVWDYSAALQHGDRRQVPARLLHQAVAAADRPARPEWSDSPRRPGRYRPEGVGAQLAAEPEWLKRQDADGLFQVRYAVHTWSPTERGAGVWSTAAWCWDTYTAQAAAAALGVGDPDGRYPWGAITGPAGDRTTSPPERRTVSLLPKRAPGEALMSCLYTAELEDPYEEGVRGWLTCTLERGHAQERHQLAVTTEE